MDNETKQSEYIIDYEIKIMLLKALKRGKFERSEIDMINSRYDTPKKLTQEQRQKLIDKL